MTYLETILSRKNKEIAELILLTENDSCHPLNLLEEKKPQNRLRNALKGADLSIIAEIKRKSPSKGVIGEIADPLGLAQEYQKGGASALSILTDKEGFGGELEDLSSCATHTSLPIIRKDFILHPLQIRQSAQAGASAILLIVSIVKKELKKLMQEAERFGLETLVEVHNLEELEIALSASSPIIGINHRNLYTFAMDFQISEKLVSFIPADSVKVAESGIQNEHDARRMKELGFDAILVGEALVRAQKPSALIKQLINGARK